MWNKLFLSKLLFFSWKRKEKNLACTHPSEHVFLRMHACTHTTLLKADLRQYFSFNNANKHLYCFVWWMAWFMRKTSHQQYFTCRIPGDSERADCREKTRRQRSPVPKTHVLYVAPLVVRSSIFNCKKLLNIMIFYHCLFYKAQFKVCVILFFLFSPRPFPTIRLSQVHWEKEIKWL